MEIQNTQSPLGVKNNSFDTKEFTRKEFPPTAEIQSWLVSYLSELLEINSDQIDVTIPFDRYNLDSSALVGVTGGLENWLGIKLDPTLLYDYPTIEELAQHLTKEFQDLSVSHLS